MSRILGSLVTLFLWFVLLQVIFVLKIWGIPLIITACGYFLFMKSLSGVSFLNLPAKRLPLFFLASGLVLICELYVEPHLTRQVLHLFGTATDSHSREFAVARGHRFFFLYVASLVLVEAFVFLLFVQVFHRESFQTVYQKFKDWLGLFVTTKKGYSLLAGAIIWLLLELAGVRSRITYPVLFFVYYAVEWHRRVKPPRQIFLRFACVVVLAFICHGLVPERLSVLYEDIYAGRTEYSVQSFQEKPVSLGDSAALAALSLCPWLFSLSWFYWESRWE